MTQEKKVKELFEDYATGFDSIYGENRNLFQHWVDRTFRQSMMIRMEKSLTGCEPIEGRRVLDVGCGSGRYSVILAKKGAKEVVGVDFSSQMLKLANQYAEEHQVADRCRFIEMDIMNYTSEEPFDYTIVMGVMDYIDQPDRFLRHLIQLTHGKIFLSFPVAGGIVEPLRRMTYWLSPQFKIHFYSQPDLANRLQPIAPGNYTIEKISNDFFVQITTVENR